MSNADHQTRRPEYPPNFPSRSWLSTMGHSWRDRKIESDSRYERTGEMADLEEAIGILRPAVHSTPDDHPRAGSLNNLGNTLESRCERIDEMVDLEGASLTL